MLITAALLLSVVAAPGARALPGPADAAVTQSSSGSRQSASGIVIAPDVEGRVAIYDADGRLLMEVDKPAGRQVRIALEPGVYEARLARDTANRARFLVGDGQQLVLGAANFREVAPPPAPPAERQGHGQAAGLVVEVQPLDARHRIEVRFGGWGDGWYGHAHDDSWGSGQGAFGFEYLTFVRNDLAVGIAVTGLARGCGSSDGHGWDETGSGQALTSIPVTVRWYPVRRATRMRSVEPYVTGGIGPVFAADAVFSHDHDDWGGDVSAAHLGTTIGGRLGGGVDFRLGSTFTLGVAGAWNWDGFSHSMWAGPRPGGGEFTMTLGWNFGR
jgi:hypothetical protein